MVFAEVADVHSSLRNVSSLAFIANIYVTVTILNLNVAANQVSSWELAHRERLEQELAEQRVLSESH